MRTAGLREARQHLSSLLDEVRKRRQVVITERGRPVARLVPVKPRRPFPELKKVRLKVRARDLRLLLEDREDLG